MKSTLSLLGLIFGTLSVALLIRNGFDQGFTAPLEAVIVYFEKALSLIFIPLEPFVAASLKWWYGTQIAPDPSWRNTTVFLMVASGAFAREAMHASGVVGASLRFVIGSVCAVLIGLNLGLISPSLDSPVIGPSLIQQPFAVKLAAGLAAVLSPIALVLGLDAWARVSEGLSAWKVTVRCFSALGFVLLTFVVVTALLISAFGPLYENPRESFTNGVQFGLVPVLGYALFASLAASEGKSAGMQILAVYGGAAVFLLCNAGLALAGL